MNASIVSFYKFLPKPIDSPDDLTAIKEVLSVRPNYNIMKHLIYIYPAREARSGTMLLTRLKDRKDLDLFSGKLLEQGYKVKL